MLADGTTTESERHLSTITVDRNKTAELLLYIFDDLFTYVLVELSFLDIEWIDPVVGFAVVYTRIKR